MNHGVYLGMDRAQYEALSNYNQSTLKKWMELGDVPSEFKYWQDHRHEEKETECLRIGGALDCAVLEPDQFGERFIEVPECDRRTKVGKEIWASFTAASNGRILLKQDEAQCVSNMHDSLFKNESTQDVFKNCKKAVLIADLFGFSCKGEIDLWEEKTEHIWDLKSLKDVSPKGFTQEFFDYGYDIQATFYLALSDSLGFKKRVFNFVCVKNSPPYTVQVHSFAPHDNSDHYAIWLNASRKIEGAIAELDMRIKANDFEDDKDWRMIDVPAWRLRQAV